MNTHTHVRIHIFVRTYIVHTGILYMHDLTSSFIKIAHIKEIFCLLEITRYDISYFGTRLLAHGDVS